jgi:hypothetical protein
MERIGHFLSSDLLLALVEKDFRESFLHLTQSCMWDRLVNDSFGSFAHKVGRPIQVGKCGRPNLDKRGLGHGRYKRLASMQGWR